ncbi:MAG: hypothetical protein PHS92_02200 [Candidatus Gracilibacteria bacterium]|nr:hypothetical protein [Candidatus Gracilibacteria bacterium]
MKIRINNNIAMNSNSFIDKHKGVYEKFYSSCDIVVSLPVSIAISGGTSCVFGGIILSQVIPHRVYVGIKRNNTGKYRFRSFLKYDFYINDFTEVIGDEFYNPGKIFFDALVSEYGDVGIDIMVLSEFDGKNSELIIGGILFGLKLFNETFNEKAILDWKSRYLPSLLSDKGFSDFLDTILFLRCQYNDMTIGSSSLSTTLCGIIDTKYPILHMQEKFVNTRIKNKDSKSDKQENIKHKKVSYISYRLDELIDVSSIQTLPYDTLVLSIGDFKNSNWFNSISNWNNSSNDLKETFLAKSELKDISGKFYLDSYDINENLDKSIDVISSYGMNVAKAFLDTFEGKEKFDYLAYFLKRHSEIINSLLGKMNIVSYEIYNKNMIILSNILKIFYPGIEEKDFFIYVSGPSVDMKYVILISSHLPKFNAEKFNEELTKNFGETSSMIFSSKHDTNSNEGIVIEQNLFSGFKNSNYNSNNFIMVSYNSFTSFDSYENLLEKGSDGIIFDIVNKKILIKGRKINSTELLSQNATIEIFMKLLDNLNVDLSNSEFSKSAYTSSKNEMISKIIIPFKRLIKSEFSKDIEISCHGTPTDFYLKLKNQDIPMYILSK